MKLLRQLKDLYPEYFWAVFGSTAIKIYDEETSVVFNKEQKLQSLYPKDVDVVTNAAICTQAFKDLLHMMTDVLDVKQEHKGKYPIDCIKKRIQVVTIDNTYDFIFVRELTKAKEWVNYQASNATQCIYELMLDPTISGKYATGSFLDFYTNGKIEPIISHGTNNPPTKEHKDKVRAIARMIQDSNKSKSSLA